MGKTSDQFNPDNFLKHSVACYQTTPPAGGTLPTELLVWRKPNTASGYMCFLRSGSTLFVHGDWNSANYSWCGSENLDWMADTDFGYFHSKCIASRRGVPAQEWSSHKFARNGRDRVESRLEGFWDEPNVKKNHPLLCAWDDLNTFFGPPNAYVVRDFMETEVGWSYLDRIDAKYYGGGTPLDTDITIGQLFFGSDPFDYPDGYRPLYDCVVHHGALRLAVQWMKEHRRKEWEQGLKLFAK